MGNSTMALVFIIAFAIGIGLTALILRTSTVDKSMKGDYDERQYIQRLKSERNGYRAFIAWVAVLVVLSAAEIEIPADDVVIYASALFVGAGAMAITGIWNEGYWGNNFNKKRFLTIMSIITVFNIVLPIISITEGKFFVDGKLQFPAISLMFGILFIIIDIETLIRDAIDKKADKEED